MSIVSKECIKIFGLVQTLLMIAMSVCFLVLSFSSSDNEVLRLLGESPDRDSNDHLERKVQYTFIAISFMIMITGSLGLTASYSLEHCMAYLVSQHPS